MVLKKSVPHSDKPTGLSIVNNSQNYLIEAAHTPERKTKRTQLQNLSEYMIVLDVSFTQFQRRL
jgi:hypothetical protein